jgi:hypothetical protein
MKNKNSEKKNGTSCKNQPATMPLGRPMFTPVEYRRIFKTRGGHPAPAGANIFSVVGVGRSGFREWGDISFNTCDGCSHNCRYCVQRGSAYRHEEIATWGAWAKERIRTKIRKITKFKGIVMFPTKHDITPHCLPTAIVALKALVEAGNRVVIVSKPHKVCIKAICKALKGHEDQVLFRFTIGTLDKKLAKFWEPGAPAPSERIACLKWALGHGFQTSVSMEPMLDGTADALKTFHRLLPLVTERIWIGKMNMKCVRRGAPMMSVVCRYLKALQSDEAILDLVDQIGPHGRVAWKDSIRKVIEGRN